MAGLGRDRGKAAHERAADSENMEVHGWIGAAEDRVRKQARF
jgi:hypothetical protein